MSPFKIRQSNNQLDCPTTSSSPKNCSKKLFGSSSTSKSSLMQRFANFASLDGLPPTTSKDSNKQKNEITPVKQSKVKIGFKKKELNFSSPFNTKSLCSLKNPRTLTSSISLPSTSSLRGKVLIPNDPHCFKIEIKDSEDSAITNNDDPESEPDELSSTSGIKTSRKEKSLGKLCRRFLLTMGEEALISSNDIHLESVARKMSKFKNIFFNKIVYSKFLRCRKTPNL